MKLQLTELNIKNALILSWSMFSLLAAYHKKNIMDISIHFTVRTFVNH